MSTSETKDPVLIDTIATLQDFLEVLPQCKENWPSLYIDLEGTNLSRHGKLSLMTVLVEPRKTVHIVDITLLGSDAFATTDSAGRSLKSILESDEVIKVFFDIRNDSDALFSLFGIHVAGIEDLQLLELASRNSSRRLLSGLAKCIEQLAAFGYQERREWRETKDKGRRLFAPELGGSYSVFDQRPLSTDVEKYCAQDVLLMPQLREAYIAKLCDAWWLKIENETVARIALSKSPGFNGKGRHMAEGPTGWTWWSPTPSERQARGLLDGRCYRVEPADTSTAALPLGFEAPSARFGFPNVAVLSSSISPIQPAGRGNLAVRGSSAGRSYSVADRNMEVNQRLLSLYGENLESDHNDDFEEMAKGHWSDRDFDYDSADDSPRDLTACDKECGYCGKCEY